MKLGMWLYSQSELKQTNRQILRSLSPNVILGKKTKNRSCYFF
uniref:Uncharacterized protein n=1 Tax=Anguilla anguilla TaxID=7936 RepID=A0A0E9UDQ2_ANGAN